MPRTDICDNLIHFTRGGSEREAFERLQAIIENQRLLGSPDMIRGGYKCICFSEVPVEHLENGLVNPRYYSPYSPFGIMVAKKWLFSAGGRPVIYQPDTEFDLLPESHRWRHMRYELGGDPPIDFTWEREWRIRVDSLEFDPFVAQIIVKDRSWADALVHGHAEMIESQIWAYSQIFDDEEIARMFYDEPFKWTIRTLR